MQKESIIAVKGLKIFAEYHIKETKHKAYKCFNSNYSTGATHLLKRRLKAAEELGDICMESDMLK